MIRLPSNKLILNGHRIFNMNQLFGFFSKKFKSEINSEFDIEEILKGYENLNIAIRHADTFLREESLDKRDEIIELLEKHGTVKQTGMKKINYNSIILGSSVKE